MSYSCTMMAAYVYDAALAKLKEKHAEATFSNSYGEFFHERGREHPDGSITGVVFRTDASNRCHRVGSFRITSDGVVARMTHLTTAERRQACLDGYMAMVKGSGRASADRHAADPSHPAHHLSLSSFLVGIENPLQESSNV